MRDKGERRLRRRFSGEITQLHPALVVELSQIPAGRPNSELDRVPPVLEGRVLDRHREGHLLNLAQARGAKEFGEMSLPGAGEIGLVSNSGIQTARSLPEP